MVVIMLVGCGVNGENTTTQNTEPDDEIVSEKDTLNQEDSDKEEILIEENDEEEALVEESDEIDEEVELTSTQRNSLNMLNYMTVLTQQINDSKESRIYLENIQSSLKNTYPNSVDLKTQNQLNNLWNTIDEYRMIDVKRERLDYIYEQNKAQAMKKAMPDPLGLLSAVKSGSKLKAIASILYMAVDSATSYKAASTETELKYLEDNWEFEDAEREELSKSQQNLFNYAIDMVRANDFPGEYALNEESVENFVQWSNEENLISKIAWFEDNEIIYKEFRNYWLELAKSYYQYAKKFKDPEGYEKCLYAIDKYQKVATRIFLKDYDYARTLPMAILSAKETMGSNEYVKLADKYGKVILINCDEKDWDLRYFVAQIYVDLYATTGDKQYLSEAYDIAKGNVNVLKEKQEKINAAYVNDITEKKISKDMTKRQKNEVKEYNKLLKETRKVEVPPVNEAFYLNCDLLFALIDELDISEKEKKEIDYILHEENNPIFLTKTLEDRFWSSKKVEKIDTNDIDIEFNGEKIIIPAIYITNRMKIDVKLSDGTVLSDWQVKEVKRPKDSDYSKFTATLVSEKGKEHKYTKDDKITISVFAIEESSDEKIEFKYEVVEKKTLGLIKGIKFKRITK